MIAPAERTRLASVLGLLASPHPGEVAAAAAAATRLLAAAGLTWPDVLMSPAARPVSAGPAVADRAAMETICHRYAGRLTTWECGFLDSIARRRVLTRKQHATLSKIAGELPRRTTP